MTLTLEKYGDIVSPHERRGRLPHTTCDDTTQFVKNLDGPQM